MTVKVLTPRALMALKPAPQGQRTMLWDAAERGFGVRISLSTATFIVMRRLGRPSGRLIRRTIGAPRPSR